MKSFRFIMLTGMMFLASFAFGQTVISGRIYDAATSKPVSLASIQISQEKRGTYSNDDGFFRLQIQEASAELTVSHIGYSSRTFSVSADAHSVSISLTPTVLRSDEVLVSANRGIAGKTPIAMSSLKKEDIQELYHQQDVPMVLEELPGVYAYSDAGNGIGYTYLNIRGFSQDRISMMYNGVPLNDPEAHAVYWVDHGDVLSDASDIQVQRGVGNTVYGGAAFGGSVNMETQLAQQEPGVEVNIGYGNYLDKQNLDLPTQKIAFKYTDQIRGVDGLSFSLRASDLSSEGYRYGSGTEQKSFHAAVQLERPTSLSKVEFLWGDEETNFSWEGISPQYGYDLDDLEQRRYNYYADSTYNSSYGDSNKDVFTQTLFLMQHTQLLDDRNKLSATVYRVGGSGYYQQYKGGESAADYNLLAEFPDTDSVELIRRKWLVNSYYGGICQYSHAFDKGVFTAGADGRLYESTHYGEVIFVPEFGYIDNGHRYYTNRTAKQSVSTFINQTYSPVEDLYLQADVRYQGHFYSVAQDTMGAFDQARAFKLNYHFLDARFGLRYSIDDTYSAFASVSTAHRDPSSNDIYDDDDAGVYPAVADYSSGTLTESYLENEFLIDYEAGMNINLNQAVIHVNAYYMDFRNELIPVYYRYTDGDEVLRGNAPKTVHKGLELGSTFKLLDNLSLQMNGSLSKNVFVEFQGDSLGWGGWGGIADYAGKIIPGFPSLLASARLSYAAEFAKPWISVRYIGKQYIDFMNTEDAAIDPAWVINMGCSIPFKALGMNNTLDLRVMNAGNALYETFGYNYYDDVDERVDMYWPAATRSFYLNWSIALSAVE